MKARDIIPEWPRGRSTSPSFEHWRFVDDIWPYNLLHSAERIKEAQRDRIYHEQQQQMATSHRLRQMSGTTAAMLEAFQEQGENFPRELARFLSD